MRDLESKTEEQLWRKKIEKKMEETRLCDGNEARDRAQVSEVLEAGVVRSEETKKEYEHTAVSQ